MSQLVESTCNAGDLGSFPVSEDPLEKGKATRSSILAWIVPWTEEPDGLQSTGSQESDTTERLSTKLKDEFFPTRNNTPGTLAQNIFSHVHVPA